MVAAPQELDRHEQDKQSQEHRHAGNVTNQRRGHDQPSHKQQRSKRAATDVVHHHVETHSPVVRRRLIETIELIQGAG